MTAKIRLYHFPLSGHAHRAQLFLSLLGLDHEIVPVDLANRAQKQPDFLALNPRGQVPVIVDGANVVHDSNAILTYLALRYDAAGRWLPRDPMGAAKVQQWLTAAADRLAQGPAAARIGKLFQREMDFEKAHAIAAGLLGEMEALLGRQDFLAADHPTIADIAHYSYVAHAPEGGCALEPYPHVRAWLARIEALPDFVAMPASPHPKAA